MSNTHNTLAQRMKRWLAAYKTANGKVVEVRNGQFWALISPELRSIGKAYVVTVWSDFNQRNGLGVTEYRMNVGYGLPAILRAAKSSIGAA